MGAVPPTAPQNGASRGRVLVVDDDAALAEMLGIVLRREGYEPAFVSDGNRAVGVFQQTRPDLVLLDLMLPGRNGLQICQDIRTQSSVTIVMLTAKGDTIDVVQGLEAGADDYVTKPFGMDELLARLRAALRRATPSTEPVIEVGELSIDLEKRAVSVRGAAWPLRCAIVTGANAYPARLLRQRDLEVTLVESAPQPMTTLDRSAPRSIICSARPSIGARRLLSSPPAKNRTSDSRVLSASRTGWL